MRRAAALALLSLAAACSRQDELNYQHCLRLRVGMPKADMLKIMGEPEEIQPYVEGKSLPYLKGRTAYEWSNPAMMPSGDRVSMDDATEKIESVRCSGAEITAPFIPPSHPSTAAAVSPSAPPPARAVVVSNAPAPGLADAVAAYSRKDFVRAMRIAGPLARGGDPDAQMLSGMIFLNGAVPGREKDGQNVALTWFYKAARQKHAEAQAVYAATLMENGMPSETVVDEIKRAADLGSPAGERLQADVYLKGLYPDIVAPDEQEGARWLKLAAQSGDPTAQLALARRLHAKDPVEAYRWALAASRHPLVDKFQDPLHSLTTAWMPEQQADAKKLLQELLLTPAQIKEAESR
jgi:hypothetical protein